MGRAAADLADFTVVTSDNPRKEKPEEIEKLDPKVYDEMKALAKIKRDKFVELYELGNNISI